MSSQHQRRFNTRRLTLCALFVALTAVCAQITIPIGAVPISLSLLPVLLCAALLPLPDALLSMAAYLLLGALGLPVFSGLSGGFGKLLGPTGGYIIGYLPCAAVIGLLLRRRDGYALRCLAMALGVLACYALGTVWFMVSRQVALMSALSVCVLPFLPFDAVKIALAALLAGRLKPVLARL